MSNFGSAMLDVPAPSSASNGELWFEPFTERIPEVGTEVRLVLTPKRKDATKPEVKVEAETKPKAEPKPAEEKTPAPEADNTGAVSPGPTPD